MARKRSRRSRRRRTRRTSRGMAAAPRRRTRRTRRTRRRSGVVLQRRRGALRGLGALPSWARALMPPVVGGGVTAGATLAIRAFVDPTRGRIAALAYEHAPLVGAGAGVAASAAMGAVTKRRADGIAGATAAVLTGGAIWAMERLSAQAAGLPAGAAAGQGTAGLGLILPERSGMSGLGEIMLEPVSGMGNPVGEQVALAGLDAPNTSVFGVESFND